MHAIAPPRYFDADLSNLSNARCIHIERLQTDAPLIHLRNIRHRKDAVELDIVLAGFGPEGTPHFPALLTGALTLQLDGGPTLYVYRFDGDMKINRFALAGLTPGAHRVIYTLYNGHGVVAYGQECFAF